MLKTIHHLFQHLVLVLPFALLLSAGSCDNTVPDDDDDTVDVGNVRCVGGAAFDSIQEAVDNCPEGGSIIVNPGLYDEDIDINKSISISGPDYNDVIVTGGGSGTIVEIDQAAGLVQISGMAFQAPYDELNTVRGFRITDSPEVLLHEIYVGFASSEEGTCDHGLVGIEASRSALTLSDSDVICVGFQSPNGGAGVLAQTDSSLTITGGTINGVGSFGVRTIDSSLSVADLTISGVNRPTGAESFESDGTAIYVEQSSEGVTIERTTISNGAFVGAWIEGPAVTVSESSFDNYAYGVYHPGDAASAAGRSTTITDSTFLDLANEAVLTFASANITGNNVSTKTRTPSPFEGGDVAGIRVVAPGGTAEISGNDVSSVGIRGIGVFGSTADGNVAEAIVTGNTVTNIIGGNGIDLRLVDEATVSDNSVSGADHAYYDDAENGGAQAGAIVNGYAVDCFNSGLCNFSNNTISGGEFANLVVVNATFTMSGDVLTDSGRSGVHVQAGQGTLSDVTISGVRGYGLYAFDATLQVENLTVDDVEYGADVLDFDGVDDPVDEELNYFVGGTGVYVVTQGAPTFLRLANSSVSNCRDGGATTSGIQLEVVDNVFTNNGIESEDNSFPDSTLQVFGVDELATSGPLITGNVFDGGDGYQGIYVSLAPGLTFTDNVVCVGAGSGFYGRDIPGASIEGNSFGSSEDPESSCGSQEWSQAIYLSGTPDPEDDSPILLADNTVSGQLSFGVYINTAGSYDLDGNSIDSATASAIYGSGGLAAGLTSDNDGDGLAEYNGDCNDDDPLVGGSLATEVPDDGIDNDCDGVTDDGTNTDDLDGDGVTQADGDCNDNDPLVFPGQPELLSNLYDDNCDGWSGFDAELPRPTITLTGNTLDGNEIGVNSMGAEVILPEPGSESSGNLISNSVQEGILVRSWSWGSSNPALTPGLLTLGAGNTISGSVEECIRIDGEGSIASIGGATLEDCGSYGVSAINAGAVTLSGTTIDQAATAALHVQLGDVLVQSGTIITGPSQIGVEALGGSLTLDGVLTHSGVATGVYLGPLAQVTATSAELNVDVAGIVMDGGTLSADTGLSIAGASGAGVSASAGTLSIDGSTISSCQGAAVSLTGDVIASIDSLLTNNNVGNGVDCDGGVLDPSTSTVTLNLCSVEDTGSAAPFDLFNGCELAWSCTAL